MNLYWVVTVFHPPRDESEKNHKECGLVLNDQALLFGAVKNVWRVAHLVWSHNWTSVYSSAGT